MFAWSKTRRFTASLAAVALAAGVAALSLAPNPAAARVFVGVGLGFPGFYYPPPYYPYYGYPPPAYYPPPPAAGYYPPPEPSAPDTSWDMPAPPAAPAASSHISYTNKPGWTDAEGRPCREYRATRVVRGRSTAVYGTACEDPDGQWRVVN